MYIQPSPEWRCTGQWVRGNWDITYSLLHLKAFLPVSSIFHVPLLSARGICAHHGECNLRGDCSVRASGRDDNHIALANSLTHTPFRIRLRCAKLHIRRPADDALVSFWSKAKANPRLSCVVEW